MRRLLALIRHLPPDSAYVRTQLGEKAGWGQDTELLASVVDGLAELKYYYLSAHEAKPDTPTRFPRPGQRSDVETVTLSGLRSFLMED